MRLPALEALAEDDIGATVDDRLQQMRILLRVVFEIRILYQHDVAGRGRKARAQHPLRLDHGR